MEKYGVELDQEKTKQSGTQVCQTCGKTFGRPVPEEQCCPICGSTANFEKRPDPKKR